MDQYENLGCIGEGTYGVVIKCRHKETGQVVAIKQFKESEDDEQVRKTVEREVRVLKALCHVNIVSLLDVFQARGRMHLVFEFVERTVLDALKLQPRGLGDACTRRIMWQLVKAVEYLHSQKVPLMHRDIKPENMLVSGEGLLKLCDFGFARPCAPGTRPELSDYVATRWYRSPELLVGDRSYGPAVDVWAIGCMAVEMHTGDPLFPGESDVDQLWLILKCMGSLTPAHNHMLSRNPYFTGMRQPAAFELDPLEVRYRKFDLPLLQFLKACLHPNPEKRATCSELLRLPYLANVEASFGEEFLAAQAEALDRLEQRAAAAKLRKHKRKSADLEPPAKAAAAAFSITASAHTDAAEAPRYRPAPSLRVEPPEAPESPRAQPLSELAAKAQAASPDSRSSAQSTQRALQQRWASGSLAGPSHQQPQQQPGQEQSSRFRTQHLLAGAWQRQTSTAREVLAQPCGQLGQPAGQHGGPPLLSTQPPLSSSAAHFLSQHLGAAAAHPQHQPALLPASALQATTGPAQQQQWPCGALPLLHGGTGAHGWAAAGHPSQQAQVAPGAEQRALPQQAVAGWQPCIGSTAPNSSPSGAVRSDYSRNRVASIHSSCVSESMSISPERRQQVKASPASPSVCREDQPSRQRRFMADMLATMHEDAEEQQSKDGQPPASQQHGQPLVPTKLAPLIPGKHIFQPRSIPKDGMIPALHGAAHSAAQPIVCSMPQVCTARQEPCKISLQRLQPTRRPQLQVPPPLCTQHSSTDVGAAVATRRWAPAGDLPGGPAPMEAMSPAGHGSRSPCRFSAAEPAVPGPRGGGGHGYPLLSVSGVQSTLFWASPPRKQPSAGRGGDSPQPHPNTQQQQPALRRSRRKSVATRLF